MLPPPRPERSEVEETMRKCERERERRQLGPFEESGRRVVDERQDVSTKNAMDV